MDVPGEDRRLDPCQAALRGRNWLQGLLVINASVELKLFHDIFIAAGVYDPVTDHLLRALKMLPR